jgi:lysozyme family protein
MGNHPLGRRDVLRLGAGVSATALIGAPAFAQVKEIADMLGVTLPDELAAIPLQGKEFNAVRMIARILALEKTADQLSLRRSSLIETSATDMPVSEASLYQSALPRLVTLIDRADGDNLEIANDAGSLLADLNAMQRVVPDALKAPTPLLKARNFVSLKDEYTRLFSTTEIRGGNEKTLEWHLSAMRTFRDRYEAVGKSVGVPWYFIGAIHGLEASFNFKAHLHNGDYPLTGRTRQVPSGHPLVWLPPSDWEASAKDALKLLRFTGQSDWSIERTLYRFEAYNGFGYRRQSVATPYLWSFSNHYERGKFVADGKWNAKAKSQQCGAAVLIKALVDGGDIVMG